jgi:Predicted redox protein, regulator of disulfide bond formation
LKGHPNENLVISYKIDKVIDARGVMCPGPILMLTSTLTNMPQGSIIMVIARDPAFEEDLKSWSAYSGNEILDIKRSGEEIIAIIRKNR